MTELEQIKEELWEKYKDGALSAYAHVHPEDKEYQPQKKAEFFSDLDRLVEAANVAFINEVLPRFKELIDQYEITKKEVTHEV